RIRRLRRDDRQLGRRLERRAGGGGGGVLAPRTREREPALAQCTQAGPARSHFDIVSCAVEDGREDAPDSARTDDPDPHTVKSSRPRVGSLTRMVTPSGILLVDKP